ncbi:hypothetical protein EV2_023578 [Malus domestica]
MGSIALQMEIWELYSDALFHVIDADTSYNVLLGRPWLHTYGVVPSTLHQCLKFLVNGEVKKVLADTDPFRGEEVNYADAKFYKQSKVTFSQPTKNEVVQKESRSLAMERKAMEQIQNAFKALMTNYTKPLRKINQSIPGGNLVVSTNLQRNNGRQGRIISFKRNEPSSKVPLKIKAKRSKAKKSAINVTIHQENDMLKAFVSNIKNHEFEGFTDLEKAMLTEEETSSKPPQISIFQRLGKIINSQPKKSHKSKKWRVKTQKMTINRDKNDDAQEEVQDVVQVCTCINFRTFNSTHPLLENETYGTIEKVSMEEVYD